MINKNKKITNVVLVFFLLTSSIQQPCKFINEKLKDESELDDGNSTIVFFDYLPLNFSVKLNASPYLQFNLNNHIILDDKFDLKNIFEETQIPLITDITFSNLKGIDIQRRPLTQNEILFSMSFSDFSFYSNEKPFKQSICDTTFLSSSLFFRNLIGLTLRKVNYPPYICPIIFKESKIRIIIFDDIANSFLSRNTLRFSKISTREAFNLGIFNLYTVRFYVYYVSVNSEMIIPELFGTVVEMKFAHVIQEIRGDFFKQLTKLKFLDFKLDNFGQFFHAGTHWLEYVNNDVEVHLSQLYDVWSHLNQALFVRFQYPKHIDSFNKIYSYPDEDFCLFRDFPHSRLVYPIIEPGKEIECTCTLLWLQKYSQFYIENLNTTLDYTLNYFDDFIYVDASNVKRFKKYVFTFCKNKTIKCDLEVKKKLCTIMGTQRQNSSPMNDVDIEFLIKWLLFILLTIFQPIVCLLGILTNCLTIVCINNKRKKKDFEESMYKHIKINSYFNILFCFISSFRLLNLCLFENRSPFCSSIYKTKSAQYIKVVVFFYLLNVLKLCSNVSYIVFALSRFTLVSNLKEKSFVSNVYKCKLIYYIFALIVVSCILNVFVLFQYTPNEYWNTNRDFPYEKRDEHFCEKKETSFQCLLFSVFKVAMKFLNDILFFLLAIVIDLILLKYFNAELDRKSKHNTCEEHLLQIKKRKKNMNQMVITNGVVYAISHLPEFIIAILLVVFRNFLTKFCTYKLSCDIINEEAQSFGFISVVIQFFIFLKFNKTFRESFNQIFKREN